VLERLGKGKAAKYATRRDKSAARK
jgi:hypothetical protein